MALKIRRGTNAERIAGGGVIFAEGELVYVTDTDALYIGDGVTAGGVFLTNQAFGTISNFIVADTVADDLKLQKNLNLNNNNIIGIGNINIDGNIVATGNIDIGDNTGDTVTITAQVDSNITPTTDTVFDLGSNSLRWRNVYASGLTVSGQIDAVAINANTVADNSSVMVNVATNTFTGDFNGNLSGNVTGDLTGNTTGFHTGDVKGSVFGDDSTPLVDAVAGVLRGNHIGTLTGNVLADNGVSILSAGTNGANANYIGTVQGNVTGNLSGNVTGNVSGNVTGNVVGNTTGFHTGDVKGSVFADGSTLLVDAVAGTIPGENITGTITASFVGNLQGNVTGDVNASTVLTSVIDTEDSSALVILPAVTFSSDVSVENDLRMGIQDTLYTNFMNSTFGGDAPITFVSNVDINRRLIVRGDLQVDGEINSFASIASTEGIGVGVYIDPFTPPVQTTVITNTLADFGTPVQFNSYTDAEIAGFTGIQNGTVIYNSTTNNFQGYQNGGWVTFDTTVVP
jgi:hypothetical protein